MSSPLPELRDVDRSLSESLRALSVSAASAGGELALAAFGEPIDYQLKADRSEVTEADRRAERAIIEHLVAARPADRFIGEEAVAEDTGSPGAAAGAPGSGGDAVTWIIDPIDGTRNFVRGIPLFACCVAAMLRGVPVAGAICDPLRGQVYSASAAGAYLNDRPLELRQPRRADDPRRKLVVAIPSVREAPLQALVEHMVESHVVRNLGSSALHLALVAGGRLDATLLNNCKLWDIAAGWLIVKQAGGRITTPDGRPLFPLDLARYRNEKLPCLAGRPEAHARLLGK